MAGWRDDCDGCLNTPHKWVEALANGQCGHTHGADTHCRHDNWVGLNTDGDVNGDDVFHYKFICNSEL